MQRGAIRKPARPLLVGGDALGVHPGRLSLSEKLLEQKVEEDECRDEGLQSGARRAGEWESEAESGVRGGMSIKTGGGAHMLTPSATGPVTRRVCIE